MKTSVVISTYNGEKYIIEQLKSIAHQTVPVDEVLIFDDGSTDDTVNIVNEYIQRTKLVNWHIYQNKENKGWRRNFMEGLWSSTGDIVFTADQDDIWMSDKVEKMLSVMQNHPEIQLLVSNYVEFYENGEKKPGPLSTDHKVHKVPLKLNYMSVDAPGCVYAIRRSLIDLSKSMWRPSFGHDTLLWRMAVLNGSLYELGDELILWRKHSDSAYSKETRQLKSQREKKKWIKASLEFNDLMLNNLWHQKNSHSILAKNNDWLVSRKTFYDTRSFINGIKLIRFWKVYPRRRQLLGDWYLVLFNK